MTIPYYLVFLLFNAISSIDFLAITYDNHNNLFISSINIENTNYTTKIISNISNLGYGLSAIFNHSLISLITTSKNYSTFYIHTLNITDHIYHQLTISNNLIDYIQSDINELYAISINKNTHNYDLVQIDYFTNTTIIKYNFNYTIDSIYASTFDTINHIYYTCVGNYDQIAIYAIDVKTFSLVSIYPQQYYVYNFLTNGKKLYVFIYNEAQLCNQLVTINIQTKHIETTLSYKEFDIVYAAVLENNIIYSIMSNFNGQTAFVITNLYSKNYIFMNITNDHLPINMWLM